MLAGTASLLPLSRYPAIPFALLFHVDTIRRTFRTGGSINVGYHTDSISSSAYAGSLLLDRVQCVDPLATGFLLRLIGSSSEQYFAKENVC